MENKAIPKYKLGDYIDLTNQRTSISTGQIIIVVRDERDKACMEGKIYYAFEADTYLTCAQYMEYNRLNRNPDIVLEKHHSVLDETHLSWLREDEITGIVNPVQIIEDIIRKEIYGA
jgi:hypothetical protein